MRPGAPLLVLALLAGPGVHAQPTPACAAAADVQPRALVGLWRAEVQGGRGATLLLEPHPRYAQSLAGEINRNGDRSRVVADLDDGALTLEESADGRHIDGTWLGDVVDGSCGREIRGEWQPAGDRPALPFVLRRIAP